uniref:Putative poly-A polymerase domain containing protein n=1 Tax=viral metagenome TaxID=1070528 RepID=A0A6M3LDN5_9ZZZZ
MIKNFEKESKIVEILKNVGYEVYIVGGFVRDSFIRGNIAKDMDIVTSANEDTIVSLLSKDFKVDVTGKTFKVIKVDGIDVASFRKDIYSVKNTLYVKEAKTIEEDLSRRDFTINAVAISIDSGNYIDPHNGLNDLERKTVRFVGNGRKRIGEDPLRIVRACRMLARIDGEFSIPTFYYLRKLSSLIAKLPSERIQIEIMKALTYDTPSIFFRALYSINALEYVIPSLLDLVDLDGGIHHAENVFDHSMTCCNVISKRYPLLRLAALLHDVGKYGSSFESKGRDFIEHDKIGAEIAKYELEGLKFSKKEVDYVTKLVELHMYSLNTPKSIRKLKNKLGDIDIKDFLRLKIADRAANYKKPNFTIAEIRNFLNLIKGEEKTPSKEEHLAINGNDIMRIAGIKEGRRVGEIKKCLLNIIFNDPNKNNPAFLEKAVLLITGKW